MHFSLDCLRIVLCKSNANELRRISWLFLTFSGNFAANEISANFPRTFEAPIVLGRRNYERYFAVDARGKVRLSRKFGAKFREKNRSTCYGEV